MSTPTIVPITRRLSLLATVSGNAAVAVKAAAETLFEAGGKQVLGDAVRRKLRQAITEGTSGALTTFAPALLGQGARAALSAGKRPLLRQIAEVGAGQLGKRAGKEVARGLARGATREVLRGAGRAAGLGLLCDGAFGAVEGLSAYRAGTMSRRDAAVHALTEAGTGAAASFAGVLVGAGLVALTGGAAAPVVFAAGAGGAIAAKLGLGKLLSKRR